MIPDNYLNWKYCIEKKCKIELSKTFIESRINDLSNHSNKHTQEFISNYGIQYHQQVVSWFNIALQEVSKT